MDRISVGDVASMSDADLVDFMLFYRLSNGDFDLPIDGWDTLSKDGRTRLAERLKDLQGALAVPESDPASPLPLDLDELDARLRQISPNQSFSLRPQPQSSEESTNPATPPYDPVGEETEHCRELVKLGGRPTYPVEHVQDVRQNPHKYAEYLRPWQGHPDHFHPDRICGEYIFSKQLARWQDFRKWQNDNRGREDDDGGFEAYVEQEKREIEQDPRPKQRAFRLAELEAGPSWLRAGWDNMQMLRDRQRRHCREHGCRGLRDYVEAVKRRLARHAFTRPFELDEDPKNQDKLTEWIEYLNYEYWWLDKFEGHLECLKPNHDELWQELVDAKIPRPHETQDFVRTMASTMELQSEDDKAEEVVKRAEAEGERVYKLTQEDPNRLQIPKATRIAMLRKATDTVLAAKRRFEEVRARNDRISDFIGATRNYGEAQREANLQRARVQWVLDQLPLVEAEADPSKAKSSGIEASKGKKRRRDAEEEPPTRRGPKMRRVKGHQEPSLARAGPSNATDAHLGSPTHQETHQGSHTKRSAAARKHQNDQPVPQQPRRSARMAARQEAHAKALEPEVLAPAPRSRSRAKLARPPRSPSPIKSSTTRSTRRQSQGNADHRGTVKATQKPQRRRQRRNG